MLDILVIERSWLQVTVDEQEQPGELLEAGDERTWRGQFAIYFICGNAGGVEVTVNGIGERAGLGVEEQARPVIRNNRCYQIRIDVQTNSKPAIQDCNRRGYGTRFPNRIFDGERGLDIARERHAVADNRRLECDHRLPRLERV